MRLAVFASGGGSNFQAIIDAVEGGSLPAALNLCVVNKPGIGALERANAHGIPTLVLDPRGFDEETTYTRTLRKALDEHAVDFIALAGYLRKIPADLVDAFRERMVNIHPALLPDFGGPGMYGRRVHAAVLASQAEFSGATVHFVDHEYDTGPTILQDAVPVLPDDTVESLASRVLEVEHNLYPAALALLAEGRVRVDDGRVTILYP